MTGPDHYAVLGLGSDASPEDIRRAYRELARRVHPDVCADADAAERFAAVARAYEILADPASRARYDLAREGLPPPPAPDPYEEERGSVYDIFRSKRGVGFGRRPPG